MIRKSSLTLCAAILAQQALSQDGEPISRPLRNLPVIDGQTNSIDYKKIAQEQTKTVIFYNPRAKDGALIPEVERAIAELANPQVVLIEPGVSVGDAVFDKCRDVGDEYMEVLTDGLILLDSDETATEVSLDVSFDSPKLVLAPECIGRSFRSILVEKNDSLWRIHKDQFPNGYGAGPDGGWTEFKKDFAEVNGLSEGKILDEGESYLVAPNSFTFTAPTDRALHLFNSITRAYGPSSAALTDGVAPFGEPQSLGEMSESCEPKNLDQVIGFNLPIYEGILTSYIINRFEKRRLDVADSPVHVAILDSGIIPTSHPLIRSFLNPITSAYGKERADYGSSKDKVYAMRNPTAIGGPDFAGGGHAEAVTGAALGGFFGSFYNSLSNTVIIHSHNIYAYNTVVSGGGAPQTAINLLASRDEYGKALTSINKGSSNVSIVNVSQSWTSDYPDDPLESFSFDGKALIVAAAGNSGSEVNSGDKNYPALYGGDEDSTIIVVAALNSDNNILVGSSFHKEYVDIGALGCNVPTIVYRGESEEMTMGFASGSSLAAPNVTFTAAMVQYLYGESVDAEEVKKRLIFSSDIVPELFEKIKDGRVLNSEKALNIYFDIVELDGEVGLQRGKVKFSDVSGGKFEICSGKIVDVSDVRKISRVKTASGTNYYIYLNSSGNDFQSLDCSTVPKMEIVYSDGTVADIDNSKLKDLVFRMR